MSVPSSVELEKLRGRILSWYRSHARDLPWRRTRDPYAIWVSEVMLQQTRVDTVRPFYARFLERWPTVSALAAADPNDVRSAWSGLGYYRRAQSMLDAAQVIVDRHEGALPSEPEHLAALPGFGPYTTGAVASIAFDRPVAAVDGNVSRVLARIFAVEGDVSKGSPARRVRDLAGRLAPGEAPGDFTQALIELGALVCKRNPMCSECPARHDCSARVQGLTEVIPPPRKRPEPKSMKLTTLVLSTETEVVLCPRPEGGLFGGMWCPAYVEGDLVSEAALDALDLPHVELEDRGQVKHLLTHRRIEARVFAGAAPNQLPPTWRRVRLDELDALGLPSFASKLLRAGLAPSRVPHRLPGREKTPRRQLTMFEGPKG